MLACGSQYAEEINSEMLNELCAMTEGEVLTTVADFEKEHEEEMAAKRLAVQQRHQMHKQSEEEMKYLAAVRDQAATIGEVAKTLMHFKGRMLPNMCSIPIEDNRTKKFSMAATYNKDQMTETGLEVVHSTFSYSMAAGDGQLHRGDGDRGLTQALSRQVSSSVL